MRLKGLRALVTGASGGIGQAIAQAFYHEGAHVCLSARRISILNEMTASWETDRYSLWPIDLSQPDEVNALIPQIEASQGPVDILVNNGGITRDHLCLRMKDEDWDIVLQVNLKAAFQLSRAVLPSMIKNRHGRIINIASIVAMTGNMGQANYTASKAGLIGLTKTLARESASAKRKITVNAIAPGYIDTPMTRELPEKVTQSLLQSIPCERMGTPEDIAYGALFLADPRAHYITGQVLHINGGMF